MRRVDQKRSPAKNVQAVPPDASPQFELEDVVRRGQHTLLLTGALDMASCPVLHAALVELSADQPTAIVLDLRKLTFMDSSGMDGVLATQELCAERGCDFWVIPGEPRVLRVFAVTGLLDRLPLQPSGSHAGSEL